MPRTRKKTVSVALEVCSIDGNGYRMQHPTLVLVFTREATLGVALTSWAQRRVDRELLLARLTKPLLDGVAVSRQSKIAQLCNGSPIHNGSFVLRLTLQAESSVSRSLQKVSLEPSTSEVGQHLKKLRISCRYADVDGVAMNYHSSTAGVKWVDFLINQSSHWGMCAPQFGFALQ